jgi:cytoskeletal protein CcmA (bactofilin family)
MTTIGPSLVITGDITCKEDMTVHGHVNGQITMTSGTLVVAPSGAVDASVQGGTITVHGAVNGDVTASERVELTDTANVTGTISSPSVALKDGATFNGMIDMAVKKASGAKAGPKAIEAVA